MQCEVSENDTIFVFQLIENVNPVNMHMYITIYFRVIILAYNLGQFGLCFAVSGKNNQF